MFTKQLERKYASIYAGLLGNTIMFGATLTVVGAVLPQMIRELGLSYTQAGGLLAAGSIAYFSSTFACGFALRPLGPRLVVVSGLLLLSAGLAAVGARPGYLFNVLAFLVMGIGHGAIEVVLNFATVRIERSGRSQLMNFMHAAFSLGALAGPLLVARLLADGSAWQAMYRLLAAATALVAIWLALLPFGRLDADNKAGDGHADGARLDRPLLALCVAALFVYVGAEIGVSAWIGEYFVTVLSATPAQGALLVSLFWAGVFAGRLGLALLYRGTRTAEAVFVLATIALLGLGAALAAPSRSNATIGFIAVGFGFSSIYPLVISVIGRYVAHRHQSMAIGFAATGGGIGSFVFPFIMATVAEQVGIRSAFLVYVALGVLLLAMAAGMVARTRTLKTASSPEPGGPA